MRGKASFSCSCAQSLLFIYATMRNRPFGDGKAMAIVCTLIGTIKPNNLDTKAWVTWNNAYSRLRSSISTSSGLDVTLPKRFRRPRCPAVMQVLETVTVYGKWARMSFFKSSSNVQQDEVECAGGYVTYGGGIVDLDDLSRLDVVSSSDGPFERNIFWILTTESGGSLRIPTEAGGAEELTKAFSALPSFQVERVVDAMSSARNVVFQIWPRNRTVVPSR